MEQPSGYTQRREKPGCCRLLFWGTVEVPVGELELGGGALADERPPGESIWLF